MIYKIQIAGQTFSVSRTETAVVKSVGVDRIQYEFDSSWSGLDVYAAFKNSAENIERHILLEDSLECDIPWEVYTKEGSLLVGAIGYRDGLIVKPTIWVAIAKVVQGVTPDGDHPEEFTPSVVGQLTARIRSLEALPFEAGEGLSSVVLKNAGSQAEAPFSIVTGANSKAGAQGYEYTSLSITATASGTALVKFPTYDDTTCATWQKGDYLALVSPSGHFVFDTTFDGRSTNGVIIKGATEDMPSSGLIVNISNMLAQGSENSSMHDELGAGAFVPGRACFGAAADATVFGYANLGGGRLCFVAGRNNKAGYGCVVFGHNNRTIGHYNFILGANCFTDSNYTFSAGVGNKSTETAAFTSGSDNEATAPYSNAQNRYCKATAQNTAAHNYRTHAKATNSTTFGRDTVAGGANQIARGKYNIEDTKSRYADVVGNGNDEGKRSNAYTLDWEGTAWYAKDIVLGGKSQDDGVSVLDKLDNFDRFIAEFEEQILGQIYDQVSEAVSAVENFESELSHERERIVELEYQYGNISAALDGIIAIQESLIGGGNA